MSQVDLGVRITSTADTSGLRELEGAYTRLGNSEREVNARTRDLIREQLTLQRQMEQLRAATARADASEARRASAIERTRAASAQADSAEERRTAAIERTRAASARADAADERRVAAMERAKRATIQTAREEEKLLADRERTRAAAARAASAEERLAKQRERAAKSGGAFSKSLFSIKAGYVAAAAAAAGAVASIRQFYEVLRASADLLTTQTQLQNLAATIGTTADAIQTRLRAEMQGMASDAQAATIATDLLKLGLVDNADQLARMANVYSQLGMNTNDLVLTLTNQTTKRFDSLNVSVDRFNERLAELESQGLSTQDAFTEAFLQQAEAQIERVGNAADTASGQFVILQNRWQNYIDSLRVDVAGLILPVVQASNAKAEAIERVNEALKEGIILEDEYRQLMTTAQTGNPRDAMAELGQMFNEGAIGLEEYREALTALQQPGAVWADILRDLSERSAEFNNNRIYAEDEHWAQQQVAERARLLRKLRELDDGVQNPIYAEDEYYAQQQYMRDGLASIAGAADDAADALERGPEAVELWAGALQQFEAEQEAARIAAIADAVRGLVDAFQGAEQLATGVLSAETATELADANQAVADSYRQIAVDAALAAAADIGTPAALEAALQGAVAIGALSQEQADLQLEIAQTQIAYEELGTAIANQDLTPDEAITVSDLIADGTVDSFAGAIDALIAKTDALKGALTVDADALLGDVSAQESILADRLGIVDDEQAVIDLQIANYDQRIDELETFGETLTDLDAETVAPEIDASSIDDANTAADTLATTLDALTNTSYSIQIDIEYNDPGPPPVPGGGSSDGFGPPMASGGYTGNQMGLYHPDELIIPGDVWRQGAPAMLDFASTHLPANAMLLTGSPAARGVGRSTAPEVVQVEGDTHNYYIDDASVMALSQQVARQRRRERVEAFLSR